MSDVLTHGSHVSFFVFVFVVSDFRRTFAEQHQEPSGSHTNRVQE